MRVLRRHPARCATLLVTRRSLDLGKDQAECPLRVGGRPNLPPIDIPNPLPVNVRSRPKAGGRQVGVMRFRRITSIVPPLAS